MQESTQIFMNENNKSFYPSNMFEFIHHPEYGCRDLKGLNTKPKTMESDFPLTLHLATLCLDNKNFNFNF
jgi:hypothetical protein